MLKCEIAPFSPDAKIVFGNNVSGLVAAKQWGRVWPLMKSNIIVTSSVFRASQKIYVDHPEIRALPVQRNPVKILYSSDACDEVRAMEGKWTNTSFVATDTRFIYDIISLIKKNAMFESLGVVGRFSSEEDETQFNIPKDSVFWFPTEAGDDYAWFEKMLPALITSLL